jgi:hypothetical protein
MPVETDNSTETTSGLTVDEQLSIAQVGYEPQDIVTSTLLGSARGARSAGDGEAL